MGYFNVIALLHYKQQEMFICYHLLSILIPELEPI